MDAKKVENALTGVIRDIQQNSGLDCPNLNGQTVPAEQVPKFDSKIWIAATTLLAGKLGVSIPEDKNIFYDKQSKSALTIDRIVELVCSIAVAKGTSEDAA